MHIQARRQEERSAATRRLLLEATVACLVEVGYIGTTSAAVAEKAGLSRGAQLHHFGTRDQLVVAAVEHLAHKRLTLVREALAALSTATTGGERRTPHPLELQEAALGLLADALSGPLYAATLELWVAARSHPDLRAQLIPAEERVNDELAQICRTLRHRRPGLDPAHPRPTPRQGSQRPARPPPRPPPRTGPRRLGPTPERPCTP